jgi:hypothetical protein
MFKNRYLKSVLTNFFFFCFFKKDKKKSELKVVKIREASSISIVLNTFRIKHSLNLIYLIFSNELINILFIINNKNNKACSEFLIVLIF